MSFQLEHLREAIAAHGRVARVMIAEHKGSSPREAGASMLVWQGGQSGTIGGGALELEAARLALDGPSVRRIPLGPALGQCCGGAVTLVTEVFDQAPEADAAYPRQIEGQRDMPMSIKRAAKEMRSGQGAALIWDKGWLIEPIEAPRTPLWIWGAGHVGRAIVDVVAPLGRFDITWVDSDMSRFPEHDLPYVTHLPSANIPDAVSLAPQDAQHLMLTYSHAFDLEICHRLLPHGFASAGVIGSATKWARFSSRLGALGHSPAQISRICCPIGQPTLGKHPQAIAVGVASELILSAEKRSRGGCMHKGIAV